MSSPSIFCSETEGRSDTSALNPRRSFSLFAALAGLFAAADSSAAITAMAPAWAGLYRPGKTTELGITLVDAAGGRTTLIITNGDGSTLTVQVDLSAGIPHRIHLPVRPMPGLPPVIAPPGAATERVIDLYSVPSGRPRWILAMPEPAARAYRPDAGQRVIALRAGDLPRSAEAYETVDLVVIDRPLLLQLGPAQILALRSHVLECGRVVALGLPQHLVDAWRQGSICSPTSLLVIDSVDDLALAIDGLLATRPTPSVDEEQIDDTLERISDPRQGRLVGVYLIVYLSTLALVAWRAPRPLVALTVPALAGMIALVAW